MYLITPSFMRKVAYGLPASICLAVVAQLLWFGWNARFIASWVFLSFMSCYLGWFLNRRSQNQEAAFFSTRIRPDDSEGRKSSVDLFGVLGAIVLVVLSLFLPWLRP